MHQPSTAAFGRGTAGQRSRERSGGKFRRVIWPGRNRRTPTAGNDPLCYFRRNRFYRLRPFLPGHRQRADNLSRAGSAIFSVRPVWRDCSGLVFLAAPRRPDTVAPGRRAPIFPALATAPRRACARLPPSRRRAIVRPLSPVRVEHKLMFRWPNYRAWPTVL